MTAAHRADLGPCQSSTICRTQAVAHFPRIFPPSGIDFAMCDVHVADVQAPDLPKPSGRHCTGAEPDRMDAVPYGLVERAVHVITTGYHDDFEGVAV